MVVKVSFCIPSYASTHFIESVTLGELKCLNSKIFFDFYSLWFAVRLVCSVRSKKLYAEFYITMSSNQVLLLGTEQKRAIVFFPYLIIFLV